MGDNVVGDEAAAPGYEDGGEGWWRHGWLLG